MLGGASPPSTLEYLATHRYTTERVHDRLVGEAAIIRAPRHRRARTTKRRAPRRTLGNPEVRTATQGRASSSFYRASTPGQLPRTSACDPEPLRSPRIPRLRKRLSPLVMYMFMAQRTSRHPSPPRGDCNTRGRCSERHHGCTERSTSFPSSFTLSSSCCPRGSRSSAVWSPLPTLPPSRGPSAPPGGSVCAWPAVWL